MAIEPCVCYTLRMKRASQTKLKETTFRIGQRKPVLVSKAPAQVFPQIKMPLWLSWGKHTRFVSRYYTLADKRLHDEVRIAIVSDLHGARYGEHQSEITAALERENPHAVLLLGDIFDHRGVEEQAIALVTALSDRFPCYFVPGNHEYKSGELGLIRDILAKVKIPILAGESVMIRVNETRVQLFGIDDAEAGIERQQQQLKVAAAERSADLYSILAIHVPNDAAQYLPLGFDLMLSGHTHGGQFAIPGLLNGLYAPGQGVFPKLGSGRYDFAQQTLVICRGLSQKPLWLPRLGNPPELCFVTLTPIDTAP